MKDKNTIIEKYKKGDFESRMMLFSHYRELREEFKRVDQKEKIENRWLKMKRAYSE